ncbi:TPA: DUF6538 domain-containing protein [Stenotrophomonas maltophilia]|uniref:DUF6538 domain-containing protein n=1 Tax=Stenotrophomonas TaxID=40323 RepID=UPI0013DA4729|nr:MULTISPECIES: DUF6538 domain-containing protein [Stenotrophomonas]MDG9988322.1 hypothetical protein [Stenotrophomonas sp. GD04024]
MRIPYNLVRAASGNFSFRQRVPGDLHAVVGLRLIKRALNTANNGCACMRATLHEEKEAYIEAYRKHLEAKHRQKTHGWIECRREAKRLLIGQSLTL